MKIIVGILSCTLTLGFGAGASATTIVIMDAQWTTSANVFLQASDTSFPLSPMPTTDAPGTYTAGGSDTGGTISATLTGSGLPGPSISASASGTGSGFESFANIEYTLDYYVEIVGPSGLVTVGVDSTGRATASSENPMYSGTGSATVQVFGYAGSLITDTATADSQLNPSDSFNLSTTIQESANSEFEVILDVDASVMTSVGKASGYGFVDPFFFIPITDPNAGDYTILTSDGIGNFPVPTVPEPSTWAMMLLGFAGLGFAGWRTSRRKSAATI
jgi:PEP-CTERM motif-containing protein